MVDGVSKNAPLIITKIPTPKRAIPLKKFKQNHESELGERLYQAEDAVC